MEEGGLWLLVAVVPWFRQEDEKKVMKKQGGNKTDRVRQACYPALSQP